jgi:hypothetical protein
MVGVGLFRERSWAIVLAPVMFVLGAVLIFSLALGELVKPAFGAPITVTGLVPPTLLIVLFVGLAVLHLKRLSFGSLALSRTERGDSRQMQALSERSEARSDR